MPCLQKVPLYPKPGGTYSYSRREGYSDRESITVACGQCQACRLRRSMEWGIRCEHERMFSPRSIFLTLTYRDSSLPLLEDGPVTPYNMTLNKKHFQDFIMRLRRQLDYHHPGRTIRYYMCGEYSPGPKYRPHYHLLLFGEDFAETKIKHRHHTLTKGNSLFEDDRLTQLWPHGDHAIGTCNYQSACYTARYIMKKQLGKTAPNHYSSISPSTGEILSREPDYNAMSNSLGRDYYRVYGQTDMEHGFCVINERRTLVPGVYYKWITEEDPDLALRYKEIRSRAAKSGITWTQQRLDVYAQCLAARTELLARDL